VGIGRECTGNGMEGWMPYRHEQVTDGRMSFSWDSQRQSSISLTAEASAMEARGC
jgi:hypothetical protein